MHVRYFLSRRAVISLAAASTAWQRPPNGNAWCGAPYPPYAYSLPWYEFPNKAGASMRIVGDAAQEKAKKLSPLLVLPPVGLSAEFLETLESLTISERRVAFVKLSPGLLDALTAQASAGLDALEAPRVHVLAHSTAAQTALALQAAQPSRVASVILSSPLTSLDDAASSEQRDALAAGPAVLLAFSTGSKSPRTCVDAELEAVRRRPAAELAQLQRTVLGSSNTESSASEPLMQADAVNVPLLLTRGGADISSEATARRLLERAPRAKLVTFAGNIAALAHVEDRSSFNAALLDFMDEVDGVATRRAIMLPGTMKPGGSVLD